MDRVLACWIGKTIGGILGAPYENQKQFHDINPDDLKLDTNVPNDDLDLQLLWLTLLMQRGVYLNSEDLIKIWQDRSVYNFCEYGAMLYNVQRGIDAPLCGVWNNSGFKASMGCPIRGEIWGLISPGNPDLAAKYAQMDGCIDHGKISIECEQFWSAAMSVAIVGGSLKDALMAGKNVLANDSKVRKIVGEVREISVEFPDLKRAWQQIVRRYGHRDASDAIMNQAISLLALFLGKGDFAKTMTITISCGWDADCTAGIVGALSAVIYGVDSIAKNWLEAMAMSVNCAIDVPYKNSTFEEISQDTALVGVEMCKTLNTDFSILNAPEKQFPRPEQKEMEIFVEYPNEPVLWSRKKTTVDIVLKNNSDQTIVSDLTLSPGKTMTADILEKKIETPANDTQRISVELQRNVQGEYLYDKNLIDLKMKLDSGQTVEKTFGLVGAKQWLAYGPFWDMWDNSKNEICPYNNSQRVCYPGEAGFAGDNYNQHVDLQREYLDEQKLLSSDMGELDPIAIETADHVICKDDICEFRGQACYYLSRTVFAESHLGRCGIFVGRSGPYKLWIDGKLIAQDEKMRFWAQHEDEGLFFELTPGEHRIVLKLLDLSDSLKTSISFITSIPQNCTKGISYFDDRLADKPVVSFSLPTDGLSGKNYVTDSIKKKVLLPSS